MKKHKLIIPFVAAAIALSGTAAFASPGHGGGHHGPNHHPVTHVHHAPRPGHVVYIGGGHHHGPHHPQPHYYYHHTKTGDIIVATALLISALM